jgi:hypothetical protein
MKESRLGLSLFLLIIFSNSLLAANRFWVGILPGNWNNTLNWSATSGGLGGVSVPVAGDIVFFDGGLGLSVGNCTINVPVSITSLTVSSGYTGTIIQGGNTIAISTTASFGGGAFTGGSANITITGAFTISATVFTSTSAILELRDNAAFTGGSFLHNNGTVRFNCTNNALETISGNSPTFYQLEFVGLNRGYNISSAGNITVANNLIISGAGFNNLQTGAIDVKGDINVTNTSTGCGGNAMININGTIAQNFNGNSVAGTGALPQLTINKTAGSLNLTNFPGVSNNFTYSAGTVNAGTSTFCFNHGSVAAYSITGSISLANIEFIMNTSLSTLTLGAGTTLTATGDLTISGTGAALINSGNINVNGNIVLASTSTGGGGSTTINIIGTGNETMDGTAVIVNQSRLPNININKASGTLSLTGNISFSANVTYTAGTVNAGTSVCYIVNNLTMTGSFTLFNLTISAAANTTLTVAAGTTITTTTFDLENGANYVVINTGTIAVVGNVIDNNSSTIGGGTGTILVNGTGAQAITSTGIADQGKFPSVTINKSSGTLVFPSLITVVGNWTYTTGTIDVITNNSTIIFANNLTITGNHSLNNISFEGSNNYTFTTAPGTTLTVLGNMAVTGSFNVTLTTGTINLIGDLNLTNTSTGGGGTTVISFAGTTNQAIHSSLLVNQSTLPAITINKSSGILTFPALITVFGNWTYVTGLFDVTTNNATVEFAGNVNFAGNHTLNNVVFEATNNWTFTVTSGTILTVTGTLTTTGIKNIFFITPVSGTTAIQAQGDIIINNTSITGGGTAQILINGTGSQAITGNAAASQGLLPYIRIQKPSGTLTLNGIISVSRDWTWSSGTVLPTTSSLIFGGNSLIITSAGMNFYNVTVTTNTSTLASSLTVLNNLSITGAAILSPGANSINLAGNWFNWGTGGFSEATSTVNFNGSSLQTITTPGGENFTNVIVNNSTTGIQLANAVAIATSLTMTQGNIALNTNTLSLGTTAVLPGTLNYTSGTMINTGSFTRWFAKTTIAPGAVAGLFPVGTLTDYRPLNVSVPLAPTTGGTITVSYTDAITNTNTSFPDGAATVVVRKDLNWGLNTTTLVGGIYNLGISGTGYGLVGNVSDLRLTLVSSVIGTAGINAGTVSNPQVNRTGLTQANLNNTFYVGSINSASSPLPVMLISFTANNENGVIKLNWETSAEVNNDHFTIQRSTNTIQWQDIQIIAGSGNTNIDSKYAAYDLNPFAGISFYRLKQTDRDGTYTFSMIRQVNLKSASIISIYPNPATDHVYVSGTENMQVQIFNVTGQQMDVPSEPTGNGVILHIIGLRAGIYFIHVLKNGNTETTNIILKE